MSSKHFYRIDYDYKIVQLFSVSFGFCYFALFLVFTSHFVLKRIAHKTLIKKFMVQNEKYEKYNMVNLVKYEQKSLNIPMWSIYCVWHENFNKVHPILHKLCVFVLLGSANLHRKERWASTFFTKFEVFSKLFLWFSSCPHALRNV